TAAANAVRATLSLQPSEAARMMPYTSEAIPAVEVSAPATSKWPGWRPVWGRKSGEARTTIPPIGPLTTTPHRQHPPPVITAPPPTPPGGGLPPGRARPGAPAAVGGATARGGGGDGRPPPPRRGGAPDHRAARWARPPGRGGGGKPRGPPHDHLPPAEDVAGP